MWSKSLLRNIESLSVHFINRNCKHIPRTSIIYDNFTRVYFNIHNEIKRPLKENYGKREYKNSDG
jgi:hypothetical protein